MKQLKKILCMFMALLMVLTVINVSDVSAAAKPKLNKKKVTMYVGKTCKLKVKNYKGKVNWYIDDDSIAKVSKKGKVKAKSSGTTYVYAEVGDDYLTCKIKVKNKKSSYKSSYTPATPTPATTPAVEIEPELNIQLPSVPCSYSDYYYSGRIDTSCTISNVRIEKSYSKYDNDFSVKLYVSGTKTYDDDGYKHSSSVDVGWKLYDMNNNVVESGTIYSPGVSIGESFVDAWTYIDTDLKPGNYRLVFINTI